MSTITAVSPAWITENSEVDQPTAGTRTSSPGESRPVASSAESITSNAEEPELTAMDS